MNVLVIGAHPDDESIGVGGSIAKHVEKGDSVYIVLFSIGHKPIQPKLKTQAYDMLKVFGISKKNLLNFLYLNCVHSFLSSLQFKRNFIIFINGIL